MDFIELRSSKVNKSDNEKIHNLAIFGSNKVYEILREKILNYSMKRLLCSR